VTGNVRFAARSQGPLSTQSGHPDGWLFGGTYPKSGFDRRITFA
jgi:hypothetical protein